MKHLLTVLISLGGAVVLGSTVNTPRPVLEGAIASNTISQPGIFYSTDGKADLLNGHTLEPRSLDSDYLWFVQGSTEDGNLLYERNKNSDREIGQNSNNRLVLVRGQF